MNCIKCAEPIPEDALYCHLCGKKQTVEQRKNTKSRGNGTGSVYKLPNGKWRAEKTLYYDENKKRHYKTKSGFKTKKDALSYLSSSDGDNTVNTNMKFINLYNEWSKQHYGKISKSAEYGYVSAYKKCEDLYPRIFSSLKTRDLQAVVDACSFQRRSKADIKSLLNNLYKYAIQNDYCDKNYAEFIKLPPKEKSKNDAFTSAEIKKIWKGYENGNTFAGYILIMIYTGMRYGEISSMKKENVFLKKKYMVGGIKTNAGIDREIPIANKILPIVENFYDANEKYLLEIPQKVFYNKFRDTLKQLGVRELSPHCCRHTFASLMAEAGVQPAVITETAGHEDYSTTMIYTHIQLKEKLKAVNKI